MLYPNRSLHGFLEKNRLEQAAIQRLTVYSRPREHWSHVLGSDDTGIWHFDGSISIARELFAVCEGLSDAGRTELFDLFGRVFEHGSFTVRPGTLFAHAGLGSIYWHMNFTHVVAVQEQFVSAALTGKSSPFIADLKPRYIDIRSGLGFNKDPATYGAVPTDSYSHSPWVRGATQPGMTGQVKEEVIARFAELGCVVRNAQIEFSPELVLNDQRRPDSANIVFTCSGVVFAVMRSNHEGIELSKSDGRTRSLDTLALPADTSADIFHRTGRIAAVRVCSRESEAWCAGVFACHEEQKGGP